MAMRRSNEGKDVGALTLGSDGRSDKKKGTGWPIRGRDATGWDQTVAAGLTDCPASPVVVP